ncbi:DUF1064 domain-containing protein [Lentilactobacillus hilgardii]|uniref:DUF1064 domain-containing protein n=1 Tax=Lentilactobacillus hilgardii TaxID=1588 RepID=UPI0021A480E7|nr:DUF1064 domain-containing protein [Lentilactobacillus hilgardii]MCT3390363.1 DUF1064 domain-containing protein [Lentilactobacillus hilgardii]
MIKKRRIKRPKQNKYRAKKVVIDGYRFDSKAEGAYYEHLRNLKLDFKIHEKFEIQPAFYLNNPHKRESACTYKPDFSIYENGELISVVDVKGDKATLTEASRLRMKMFMYQMRIPVVLAVYDYRTGLFEETVK